MKEKRKSYNRVAVDGNIAIKPYFYIRNKHLHVRYTNDKCVELTDSELERLYKELTEHPERKQEVFAQMWSIVANLDGRPLLDGVKVADRIVENKRKENGQ